jgi:hypothetical protein
MTGSWSMTSHLTGVKISDPKTGAIRVLGYDHIQKYTSDLPLDGSVQGIAETLEHWHALEEPLDNYNIWNVLMQRVAHSLRLGQSAVRRFCPNRLYDELVPVAGTLIERSQQSVSLVDNALKKFQERCTAAGGSVQVSNPMGLRTNGRR